MRKSYYIHFSIVLISLLVFVVFAYLGFYNHPDTDMVSYFNKVSWFGLSEAQVVLYNEWTGRFTSNLFMTLLPRIFGMFVLSKTLVLVSILGLVGSTYWLLGRIKRRATFLQKIISALLLNLVFFSFLPGLDYGLFWVAGNLTYILPMILLIVCCGYIIEYQRGKKNHHALLVVLLTIAICGSSEIMALNLLLSYFFFIVLDYAYNKKISIFYFGLLLVAFLSCIVVLAAPGNTNRVDEIIKKLPDDTDQSYGDSFNLRSTLIEGTSDYANALGSWLGIICLLGIYLHSLGWTFKRLPLKTSFPIICITLISAYANFLVVRYVTGYTSQRALTGAFLVFITIGVILLLSYLPRYVPSSISILSIGLLMLFIIAGSNFTKVISELSTGNSYRYNSYMLQLYSQLRNCAREDLDTCYVSTLPEDARSILTIYEVGSDGENYNNSSVRDYFRLNHNVVGVDELTLSE
jgi:hypothetical protein